MSEHKLRERAEEARRKEKKSARDPERRRRAPGGDIKGDTRPLKGKHVAILATDGFEQSELVDPRDALDRAGAMTTVIAPHAGAIKGWQTRDWADEVEVDLTLDKAHADDYDALLLPGGVLNPDTLRTDAGAVTFVRSFFEAEKPVAAICHGPMMLIEADVLHDRHVTSWPSLRTDIRNAGGQWSDEEVVVDRGLVTSRKPADIPAFNRKMIEEFAESAVSTRTDRGPVEA